MNTGQTILTVGALMLLSTMILSINNSFYTTSGVLLSTQSGIIAVSLGSSMLEQIEGMAFDNATDNNSVTSTSSLTVPSALGPEAGEVDTSYNDVDDFNGYTKIDSTLPAARFTTHVTVYYVASSSPDVKSSIATWNKKIIVSVSSPSMTDTVTFSYVFSYWTFR